MMNPEFPANALIAEDEPLLADHLQSELARLWPTLRVVANVRHGEAALQQALAQAPDVLFLDIRMPGMSGLEAALALAEDWPTMGRGTDGSGADVGAGNPTAARPFPVIVFVTAYDQYALQAFDLAAVDYVLKPVQTQRLAQTCQRVQAALRQRRPAVPEGRNRPGDPAGGEANTQATLDAAIGQLRSLLASGVGGAGAAIAPAGPPLRVIQAGVGAAIHLVPVDEVLYFEAADKYVRVVTAAREHLIRLSLRELLPQLDPQRFWQVHRGTVVRCDAIETAVREESGKVTLTLRGHADRLTASRLYAHLFKAM